VGKTSSGLGRSTRGRDYSVPRVAMLAGWLFADLFLVLFIVAFSSQPAIPASAVIPKPKPTVSPSPVASPKPQMGLEQNPVNITVPVSPADVDDSATHAHAVAALLSGLHSQLAAQHLLGERSGFVLIFATGTTDQINEAVAVASSVISILKTQDAVMFGKTSGEGLWGGSGTSGSSFHFQIFFFTQ
jgi:hypothetical protein